MTTPTPVDEGTPQQCGVAWASHMCRLPVRHDGDHGCIDEDDNGVPHETCPRTGVPGYGEDYLYCLDLTRYPDGAFCDICGPVEPAPHPQAALDHAMASHPTRWVEDGYAKFYDDYLGNGEWRS